MASSPGHGQQARAQQRRALALADVAPDDDVDAAGLVFEGDKDCETSYKDRDGKSRGQRGVTAAKT